MNKNLTWIDELKVKRESLYSTVLFVLTNDDKRIKEYIERLVPDKKALERKIVVVYDTYGGLSRVGRDSENRITLVPETDDGGDVFGADAMKSIQKIMDAESKKGPTLKWSEPKGRSVFVVLKNMLSKEDVKNSALNLLATDESVMGMGHTIVLFTPDKSLVNSMVLDKCQLIEPPLSLPDERRDILESLDKNFGTNLGQDTKDRLVALTAGLDLNQTEGVLCETLGGYKTTKVLDLNVVSDMKASQINKSSVLRVKGNVRNGFERVGGYSEVKRFITETIIMPMKEPDRARALGIEQPKGAIFFGPPGTGKTILVESLAKELGLPFVTLDPENFMSAFVGESEKNLRNSIQIIEAMAPVVVFIDESMADWRICSKASASHPLCYAVRLTNSAGGAIAARRRPAATRPDGCSRKSLSG